MALSDLTVRQAKAAEKTYGIPDIDGLGLVVTPTGGKSWHLRYYWLGKQKRISLGTYPEIGLREARTLRDEARALRAKGINPILIANVSDTLSSWPRTTRSRRSSVSGSSIARRNSRRAGTARLRRSSESSARTCCSALKRCRSTTFAGRSSWASWRRSRRKAFTTAEKVRTWLGQLFRYALVIVEGMEANPATDLDVVAEPKPPVNHNPYLHLHELPGFLQKLRLYNPRGWQTQLGIRLLLLTGVRTGELRLAPRTSSTSTLVFGLFRRRSSSSFRTRCARPASARRIFRLTLCRCLFRPYSRHLLSSLPSLMDQYRDRPWLTTPRHVSGRFWGVCFLP